MYLISSLRFLDLTGVKQILFFALAGIILRELLLMIVANKNSSSNNNNNKIEDSIGSA